MRRPGSPVAAQLSLLAVAAAGFVLLYLTWHGVAPLLQVPLQLPWLVSAGFTGGALVATALATFATYDERRAAATRRSQGEAMIDELTRMAESLERVATARTQKKPAPARRRKTR